MQRLDPDAIARQQQRPRSPIPDGEPEHPAETADGGGTPLLVRVNDRFRVGAGVEAVPRGLELPPQLTEVVDLAVEDGPDRSIFVVDRLVAGGEIDDAQAP